MECPINDEDFYALVEKKMHRIKSLNILEEDKKRLYAKIKKYMKYYEQYRLNEKGGREDNKSLEIAAEQIPTAFASLGNLRGVRKIKKEKWEQRLLFGIN